MERIYSFEPIYCPQSRVLVLGSMPSAASLQAGMYYAHPRNAFWPILYALWGVPFAADAGAWRAFALTHGIAIWDVCQSCVRHTSADADIHHALPNDIPALLDRCPNVADIFLNGGTAARLFQRWVPKEARARYAIHCMPSTSPAYTKPFAQKLQAWRALYDILQGADHEP